MPRLCAPVLHFKTLAQVLLRVCTFKIYVRLKNCANEGHVEQNIVSCIVWKTSIKENVFYPETQLECCPFCSCRWIVGGCLGMLIMTGKVKLISAPFELAMGSSWYLHADLTEFKLIKSLSYMLQKYQLYEEAFICRGLTRRLREQTRLFIKWRENTLCTIKPAQCRNRLCLDMLNKAYHYALLGAKWYLKVHKFN